MDLYKAFDCIPHELLKRMVFFSENALHLNIPFFLPETTKTKRSN